MSCTSNSLLVVILLLGAELIGQPSNTFSFKKYEVQENLPDLSVYGIFQDSNKHIWIGTDLGLYQFDGASFNKVENKELKSVCISRIFNWYDQKLLLLQSHAEKIWTLTNGKCQRITTTGIKVQGKRAYQSTIDTTIVFWFRNNTYSLEKDGLSLFYELDDYPKEKYSLLHNFKKDSIFISTNKTALLIGKDTLELPDLKRASCLLDFGDSAFVFVDNNIFCLKEKEVRKLAQIPTEKISVRYAISDLKGNIWFSGHNKNLYFMNGTVIKDVSESFGLDSDQITYLFRDTFGNIWISTNSSGLVCIFDGLFTNYTINDGLASNVITAMTEWNEVIYVGTNSGLNAFTRDSILAKPFSKEDLTDCEKRSSKGLKGYIHHLNVLNDKLFVSTNFYDSTMLGCESEFFFVASCKAATAIKDTLIFGKWGIIENKKFNNSRQLINKVENKQTPHGAEYFMQALEGTTTILIGTDNGLFSMKALKDLKRYEVPFAQENVSFFDIYLANDGTIWFATSIGLIKKDSKDKWTKYDRTDGLTSNFIRSLEGDQEDRIWLGTDRGLNMFDHKTFTSYTKSSGIISNLIKSLVYSPSTNTLWIGSNSGVSKLNINRLSSRKASSFPLFINDFEVDGSRIANTDGKFNLDYDQKNIRIHFAALNFISPTDLEYQYRLIPIDSSWKTTRSNSIEFYALSPADYIFEVRSRSSGTKWSDIKQAVFIIAPPYWQSKGFLLMSVLLTMTISWLLFWLKLSAEKKRAKKRNLLFEKIIHLEQQALSLSMNPHFIFNSMNSIQAYFSHIKNEEANEYISNFAKLIRLTMESSSKKKISIKEEIDRLKIYFLLEKKRLNKPLDFLINVSEDLFNENPEIPNMLIQPLIENAIWHGIMSSKEAGEIELNINQKEQFIYIEVIDNGIGINEARKRKKKYHHSKGLAISEQRLKLLSEDNFLRTIDLSFGEEGKTGTKIILRIAL